MAEVRAVHLVMQSDSTGTTGSDSASINIQMRSLWGIFNQLSNFYSRASLNRGVVSKDLKQCTGRTTGLSLIWVTTLFLMPCIVDAPS